MQAPQQSLRSRGVVGSSREPARMPVFNVKRPPVGTTQHLGPDGFAPREPVEGGLRPMSLLSPRHDTEMERFLEILETMPPMVVEMLNTGEMTIDDVMELHDRMNRVNQPSQTGQAAAIPGVPFLPTGYMMAPPR